MIKINGWQRIGVVCSGAWLIIVAVLVLHDYSKIDGDRYRDGRYLELGGTESCFQALMGNESAEKECDQERGLIVRSIHVKQILIDAFAPIVIGWILFYSIVCSVNWIAIGFKKDG